MHHLGEELTPKGVQLPRTTTFEEPDSGDGYPPAAGALGNRYANTPRPSPAPLQSFMRIPSTDAGSQASLSMPCCPRGARCCLPRGTSNRATHSRGPSRYPPPLPSIPPGPMVASPCSPCPSALPRLPSRSALAASRRPGSNPWSRPGALGPAAAPPSPPRCGCGDVMPGPGCSPTRPASRSAALLLLPEPPKSRF